MSQENQLLVLILLTIFNGILIYVWIRGLRNMKKQNKQKKELKKENTFWYENTDDGKPYTSLKDWKKETKHLVWPTIIFFLFLIILIILISIYY